MLSKCTSCMLFHRNCKPFNRHLPFHAITPSSPAYFHVSDLLDGFLSWFWNMCALNVKPARFFYWIAQPSERIAHNFFTAIAMFLVIILIFIWYLVHFFYDHSGETFHWQGRHGAITVPVDKLLCNTMYFYYVAIRLWYVYWCYVIDISSASI